MLVLILDTKAYAYTLDAGTSIALVGGKMQWNDIFEGLAVVTTYTATSVSIMVSFTDIGLYLFGIH